MIFQESETVELKAIVVEDIKKEIIAFANCEGGKLYIGVQDDGTVSGLDNPDETSLQISNMVRDAIKPDLTMFLHYETVTVDGKKIVAVDIQQETDGDCFEEMRSLEQNLTFESAKKIFAKRNVKFDLTQMKTLGMVTQDGVYTNLGLLLSDQCVHTIKAAVFQGTTQSEFKDRKEFSGSLFRQMDEAYDFIDFRNQTHSTFEHCLV